MTSKKQGMKKKKIPKGLKVLIIFQILIVILLFGALVMKQLGGERSNIDKEKDPSNSQEKDQEKDQEGLSEEEIKARKEAERLQAEILERKNIVEEAEKYTESYDYDRAIEHIKSYQGREGGYELYPNLVEAVRSLEERKDSLLLYGGVYHSAAEVSHVFFHSLIADNSKAFDGDFDSVGYNMYMTTVSEFKNMIWQMYQDDFVLVSIYDLVKKVTDDNGKTRFVEAGIYLPEGKKPFVLSQDDVNYYEYMDGDGFASRIVIDENGKPTCEMKLDDGSVVTGPFDIVPILDAFVEEYPDFSYKGAKGILALTGYEGALGYRTNDPTSPTYEEDKETVKELVEVLKANGWDFASHSWGHKNSQTMSYEAFKRDTERWNEEVASLIGDTDIYIFPFGIDIEASAGNYSSDKYHLLKDFGFDFFCGVYKSPWMHIRDDYVRMTRRPLDGQAMLEFPERLEDLFDLEEIIDPERPAKNW